MKPMKVIVRFGMMEALALFMAGYFVGKNSNKKEEMAEEKPKKSVTFQDGKLIFTIR